MGVRYSEVWTALLRGACVGAALSAGACLDVAAVEPPPEPLPALEIGTGTYRFEPVPEGAGVPLVFGAQGGWHIWVAVRIQGLADDAGSFEVTHYPLDDPDAAARVSHGIRLDPPNTEGWRSYVGWPAMLTDAACGVDGLYRVEVVFRPASGGRLSAERDVVIEPGLHPPPPCAP